MKIEMFDVKARYLTPYEQENFTFLPELEDQSNKWIIISYKETRAYVEINQDFLPRETSNSITEFGYGELGYDPSLKDWFRFIADVCILFKDNALSEDFI